jgi:hypothetical protein
MHDNEYYGMKLTINESVIHIDDTPEDLEFDKVFRETLTAIHKIISEAFVENKDNI